jgi:HSP20 family protein
LASLIPLDDIKRLQKRMNRLMQELGLSDLESKYLDEMQKIQARINEITAESEAVESDIMMPMADVKETDDSVEVSMDLPGVDKKDIDISVSEDDLRVSATRQIEKDMEEKGYHKRERICSRFERTIRLPVAVKSEEAKANLADGVLKITLPKEVVTSRKRITID